MLDFMVDDERCTRCRACMRDCPTRIIGQHGTNLPTIAPENESKCIRCQHCMAICPTAAISILGKQPTDSLDITPEALPPLDALDLLVRSRRSIRRFEKKNVDPDLISRLLAATANAPTGANQRDLTFNVVDDRETMIRLRTQIMKRLQAAADAGAIPEQMAYLHMAIPGFFKYGSDVIFRGAPHMLIVSAGPKAFTPHEDITIALTTFELLATSAGLGTAWCGMLKMACETVPEIKSLVGLPQQGNYYAILFGIPAVEYPRTTQRDDSATIKRIACPE